MGSRDPGPHERVALAQMQQPSRWATRPVRQRLLYAAVSLPVVLGLLGLLCWALVNSGASAAVITIIGIITAALALTAITAMVVAPETIRRRAMAGDAARLDKRPWHSGTL